LNKYLFFRRLWYINRMVIGWSWFRVKNWLQTNAIILTFESRISKVHLKIVQKQTLFLSPEHFLTFQATRIVKKCPPLNLYFRLVTSVRMHSYSKKSERQRESHGLILEWSWSLDKKILFLLNFLFCAVYLQIGK